MVPMEQALAMARTEAARALTDRVVVHSYDPEAGTFNPATLAWTSPAADTALWEGKALVTVRASARVGASGASVTIDEVNMRVPVSTPELPLGALVRVIEASDSQMRGQVFEIARDVPQSLPILRRYVLARASERRRGAA